MSRLHKFGDWLFAYCLLRPSLFVVVILAICLMFMLGCATNVQPRIIPAPPDYGIGVGVGVDIQLGINGGCGYHGPIDNETLVYYNSFNRTIICRYPVENATQLQEGIDAVRPYPNLRLSVLLETVDHPTVESLASLIVANQDVIESVELGNETDLAGVSSAVFSAYLQRGRFSLRSRGFQGAIISGGIFSTQSLNYLVQSLVNVPEDVEAGVHLYAKEPTKIRLVQDAIGNRLIDVTEAGCVSRTIAEEGECLSYLRGVMGWLKTASNLRRIIFYQHTDGPGDTDLDRYGFRAFDGRWKVLTEVLK